MTVPYSAALKATTQAIVKVRGSQDSISKKGQSALNKAELAVRARAHQAFRMVYPKAWAAAKIPKATPEPVVLTAGPVSIPARLQFRRRTQTELLLAQSSGISTEESGRGMRSRAALPTHTYNMHVHPVDDILFS